MRNLADVAFSLSITQIGREPTGAHRAVDFEHGAEQSIGNGCRWTALAAGLRDGLLNSGAKVAEQSLKFPLLILLSFVVCGPILRIGLPRLCDRHLFGDGRAAILFDDN